MPALQLLPAVVVAVVAVGPGVESVAEALVPVLAAEEAWVEESSEVQDLQKPSVMKNRGDPSSLVLVQRTKAGMSGLWMKQQICHHVRP